MKPVLAALIAAVGFFSTSNGARAQTPEADVELALDSGERASAPPEEGALTQKVHRLRVAGGLMLGAGALAFASVWVAERLMTTDSDSDFRRSLVIRVGLGVAAASLLALGGGLLLRARLLIRRHRRARVEAVLGPTSARLRVEF